MIPIYDSPDKSASNDMILIAESRTRVIKSGVHLGNAGLIRDKVVDPCLTCGDGQDAEVAQAKACAVELVAVGCRIGKKLSQEGGAAEVGAYHGHSSTVGLKKKILGVLRPAGE